MDTRPKHRHFFPVKKTQSQKKPEAPRRPSTLVKTLPIPELSSKIHLFLFLLYSGTSLNTQIPTSYLSIKSAQKKALFYFRGGELHMESDRNSYDKFFELTKESELRKYKQPKYIHFTSSSVYLYTDEAEAREKYTDQDFSLLQKYLYTSCQYAKKMRVCWNKEKGFSYSLVSNKNPLPMTEWFATELSLRPKNSVYMFNVTDYNYAGRLLKTSLSPFNLHSSKMKSSTQTKKKIQMTETFSSKTANKPKYSSIFRQTTMGKYNFNSTLYLTRHSDQANTVSSTIHIHYAQLEGIIKDFIGMINRWRDLLNANPFSEAFFDFIENSKGSWFLIGCKVKGVDLELLLQSLSLRRFTRTSTYNPFEAKKIEHSNTEEENLKKKFLSIKERLSSINVQPANFVSIDKESGFSLYSSFSGSLCMSQNVQNATRETGLSPLALMYDKTMLKAKEMKEQARVHEAIFKEYSLRKDVIEEIITDVVNAIGNHEVFEEFVKQGSRNEGLREFIDGVLKGNMANSRSVAAQVVRDVGVNGRNFQEFLMCFNGALEKYYDEECLEMMMSIIIESVGFSASEKV